MANYTVDHGHRALGPWSLTASQVDKVTFTDNVGKVCVINDSTSGADVWATNDGTDPTVPSAHTSTNGLRVPPGGILDFDLAGVDEVRLVSSGTPSVSVQIQT